MCQDQAFTAIIPGDRVEFFDAASARKFGKVDQLTLNYRMDIKKLTAANKGWYPFIQFVFLGLAVFVNERDQAIPVVPAAYKVYPGLGGGCLLRPMDHSAFSGFYPTIRAVLVSLKDGSYTIEVTI